MKYPYFVGPSYVSQSLVADAERSVNWYVEPLEAPGAKARFALYPTPGVTTFASASESPGRGLFATDDGRLFAVIGHVLYESSSVGVLTTRGTVVFDSNPVTFCTNGDGGDQLFICSGDHGYIFDLNANTLTQVLASGARMGGFLDGFFLALDTTTSTLQISNSLNGLVWSPSQIAQRTAGADRWIAMAVVRREIWLMGSETSEVWYNAGSAPFPFAPIPGAFLEHGILAPFSIQPRGSTPMWVGRTKDGAGVLYQGNGYAAQRVSTHAVELAVQGYDTATDALGWTYQDQGHSFYISTFPTAGATWGYDDATGLFHERGYWNTTTAQYEAWRPQFHAFCFGKHLVGDRSTGTIYEMSIANGFDVGGAAIRRMRRAPHLTQERLRTFYNSLELDMETGVGLATGQGSDPTVMLRWSDDGGRMWGNEHWTSAGAQGKYKTRVRWNRLGSSRDRVFEVVVSDPVAWRIVDCYVNASVGTN